MDELVLTNFESTWTLWVWKFNADVTEFTSCGKAGCWQKGKEFQWEKLVEERERWRGETSRPSWWWERFRGRAENGKLNTVCVWAPIWLVPEAVLRHGFSSCLKSDLVKKMKSVLQRQILVVHVMGWKSWWTWSCVPDHGNWGLWLFKGVTPFLPRHLFPSALPVCSRMGLAQKQNSDGCGKGRFSTWGNLKISSDTRWIL